MADIKDDFGKAKTKTWWKHELKHDGPRFPRPYAPLRLELRANKGPNKIDLSAEPAAEEMAVIFGRLLASGRSLDATFKANFWGDWQGLLTSTILKRRTSGTTSDDWDFARLYADAAKAKITSTAEPKKKHGNQGLIEESARASVDGSMCQMTRNGLVDAPGIFFSRSAKSPHRGHIRVRLVPADVTLNRSAPLSLPSSSSSSDDKKWAAVVQDRKTSWVAAWTDSVTGKRKYVYFMEPRLHGHVQNAKFAMAQAYGAARARLLQQALLSVRADSTEEKERQCAMCFVLLDAFGVRPGHERLTRAQVSDTRGIVSLRRENVAFADPRTGLLTLDFVGKDSVRFVGSGRVPREVVLFLRQSRSNATKESKDSKESKYSKESKKHHIFDAITASDLNAYLSAMLPGLTAKVIRTFHASAELEKALAMYEERTTDPLPNRERALSVFRVAVTRAAALCNHQRTSTKCNRDLQPGQGRGIDEIASTMQSQLMQVIGQKESRNASSFVASTKCWAPTTTLSNYIDPAIVLGFAQRHGLELTDVVSPTLAKRMLLLKTRARGSNKKTKNTKKIKYLYAPYAR
jgi:DNA topoisomerase-1